MHDAAEVPHCRPMDLSPQEGTALCYGRDDLLLLTRQWMVMQLGVWCEAATNAAEYRAALGRTSPSIIVLCQTLSREECTEASHFAAERSPESRLVVMFTGSEVCEPKQAHVLLASSDGPKAFSRTISDLIEHQSFAESLSEVPI